MAINAPTAGFSLGIDGPTNVTPRRWNHELSDVRAYRRALTAAELLVLAGPIDMPRQPAAGTLALSRIAPIIPEQFQGERMPLTINKQTLQVDAVVSVVVSDVVANADNTGFMRKFDFFTDDTTVANRSPVITIIVTAADMAPLEVTTPTLQF